MQNMMPGQASSEATAVPYADKPESDPIRVNLENELDAAQKAYDDAINKYNELVAEEDDFDINQARTSLEIAKRQQKLAQDKYDMLCDEPDPDQVKSTEERIATATARLAAAEDDLGMLELIATMDGTVVDSDLLVGKSVSPDQPVVQVVDFLEWFVEMEDLSEIEVVDIGVGQKASLTADALPDVKFTSEVVDICDTYKENRSKIVNTVPIKLDEVDPRLRWGMTVVAEFAKK